MPNQHNPFYPIIYVRGYAMTQDEIDTTTADPFNGFNIGSTVYRATTNIDEPRKFVFESPIVRLASDYRYEDVYHDGQDILDPGWEFDATGQPTGNQLNSRSIIIHRYYDKASRLLGDGEIPSIGVFAQKLSELIKRVQDLLAKNVDPREQVAPEDFRCYLVAHSMGGLVCRAFLQNPVENDPCKVSQYVDKFFTYATPHNGIDLAGINVPRWLEKFSMNTFNRDEMAKYLGLNTLSHPPTDGRVDWFPESNDPRRFQPEKIFCMVGTNRQDYDVGMGLSRTFAGNGSDGLVRIDNATLKGLKPNGEPGEACAKAFAYRSHSGVYGIVNSEEAYQNLTRFLFGNVRVDIFVDVSAIRLPAKVQAQKDLGKRVDALYQFEVLGSPKAKPWYLTRRVAVEDSVACLSQTEWEADSKKNGAVFLSTVFLANRAKVPKNKATLEYQLILNIRVPDYEIENKFWFDQHYEGQSLFKNAMIIALNPPDTPDDSWKVEGAWQGSSVKEIKEIKGKILKDNKLEVNLKLPTNGKSAPGIDGKLRLVISAWNPDAQMEE